MVKTKKFSMRRSQRVLNDLAQSCNIQFREPICGIAKPNFPPERDEDQNQRFWLEEINYCSQPRYLYPSQSAFVKVKDRLLVENVLLASELVQGFNGKNASPRGHLIP